MALDSTTPAGSVGLLLPNGERDLRPGDPNRTWGERLPGDLLDLLGAHGLRPADVDLFAVAAGPGSLTGLRVGIATIQGLAFGTRRPVAAISALDALAEHGCSLLAGASAHEGALADGEAVIGAWANALRGEVFTALYERRAVAADDPWVPVGEPEVSAPRVAALHWRERLASRRLLVVGDVEAELTTPLLEIFGADIALRPRPLLAEALISIAVRRAARGQVGPPHAVRPLYVRKPDAVLARERAAPGPMSEVSHQP